jgi:hypothetical protein
MNLGFNDDHRRSQPLSHGACFVFFEDYFAPGNRNAELREDCLSLILVNLHSLSIGCGKVPLEQC